MEKDKNGNELMEIEEIAVSDGGAALLSPVDVQSGEEKYDLLWQENGKLLRFDEGEHAWKDRGPGTAKIMRRKDDPGKFMFVFRRETVGKIGAQHHLLKNMNIKIHPQNEKALLWTAHKDYADDDEGFPESFVLRFTSKELAEKGLDAFENAFKSSTL